MSIINESDRLFFFFKAAICLGKGQDTMLGAHRSWRHCGLQRTTGDKMAEVPLGASQEPTHRRCTILHLPLVPADVM